MQVAEPDAERDGGVDVAQGLLEGEPDTGLLVEPADVTGALTVLTAARDDRLFDVWAGATRGAGRGIARGRLTAP